MEKNVNWDPSLFEKNLQLLEPEQRNPALFPPLKQWEICRTGPKTEWNLREKKSGRFLYYPGGIEDEVAYWRSSFSLENKQLLIIYGLGLGYYYDAVAPWLHEDPKRRLVFVEPDAEVMRAFLETDQPERFFSDAQVEVLFDAQDIYSSFRLESLSRLTFHCNKLISSLASYAKDRMANYHRFKTQLEFFYHLSSQSLSEYLYGGAFYFENYFHNFLHLEDALWAGKLFNAFKNVPAIICGAGPSLEKQIPDLMKLKERALIFAGGTAMNALNAFHLNPHFGAGVDPFEAQMSRILVNEAFMVPYFIKGRMYASAVDALMGDKLYLRGYDGYQIANWMEERLGLEPQESLNLGANIVNMCVSIANKLGCNPILCVGVDLAYTEGNPYSKGVIVSGTYNPSDKLISKSVSDELVLTRDIHGKDIYTLHKWMTEALWFGSFARDNPDLILLNCTEGGIGFPGIANLSLREAADKYLNKDLAITEKLNKVLTEAKVGSSVLPDNLIAIAKGVQQDVENFLNAIKSLNKQETENKFDEILLQEGSLNALLRDFNSLYKLKEMQSHQSRYPGIQEILIERSKFFEYILRYTHNVLQREIALKELEINLPLEKEEESFHDDKDCCYYYPNGRLRCRVPLKNGLIDGVVVYYYPNGRLKREIAFREGIRHGRDLYYSLEGKLLADVSYFKYKPYGVAKEWYRSGVLKKEIRYFTPGTIVEVISYDPQGKKLMMPSSGKDYYENIILSSDKLKDSFIALMRTLEKASLQHGGAKEDLLNIREELKSLDGFATLLKKEAGLIPGEYKEPLWKSPETKDALASHIDTVSDELRQGMEKLQDQLKAILERLKDAEN